MTIKPRFYRETASSVDVTPFTPIRRKYRRQSFRKVPTAIELRELYSVT